MAGIYGTASYGVGVYSRGEVLEAHATSSATAGGSARSQVEAVAGTRGAIETTDGLSAAYARKPAGGQAKTTAAGFASTLRSSPVATEQGNMGVAAVAALQIELNLAGVDAAEEVLAWSAAKKKAFSWGRGDADSGGQSVAAVFSPLYAAGSSVAEGAATTEIEVRPALSTVYLETDGNVQSRVEHFSSAFAEITLAGVAPASYLWDDKFPTEVEWDEADTRPGIWVEQTPYNAEWD